MAVSDMHRVATSANMGEDCLSCLTCVLSFCLFEQ